MCPRVCICVYIEFNEYGRAVRIDVYGVFSLTAVT